MFKKILIANRGEIACRIIKTAKKLNIGVVAIFSDIDAHALHVQLADEAYPLNGTSSHETYLNQSKIIDIAKQAAVQAIHPGYGFLSENFHFAELCQQQGLVFIGPTPKAIQSMGDKTLAKIIMEKAGVPVIPGFHGEAQDFLTLKKIAEKIGFPLLVKASAGGGGKGMRLVENITDLEEALKGAQREAANSFGNSKIFLEKYLPNARHIEAQILFDSQGHGLYLFNRDCSIQRRHQKIIEEAPAINLSIHTAQNMAKAAIQAGHAIQYQNAGTIEFLVDEQENFYFMEMNTRLQVEHPVTEMITGLDLVEWQLRIAAGEDLKLSQAEVKIQGHAIEVRVYAENPANNFMPSAGVLQLYQFPDPIPGELRIDTGFCETDKISIFYDPLLAKIIVWGQDRLEAVNRLQAYLKKMAVSGVATNLDLLNTIAEHSAFSQGKLSTQFLDQHLSMLLNKEMSDEIIIFAGLFLFKIQLLEKKTFSTASQDTFSPWRIENNWRLNTPSSHKITLFENDRVWHLKITQDHDNHHINGIGPDRSVQCYWKTPRDNNNNLLEIFIKNDLNENKSALIFKNLDQLMVFHEGAQWIFSTDRNSIKQNISMKNQSLLASPMPGTLIEINVVAGQIVKIGEKLLIIEAMKMEHSLISPHTGQIKSILFKVGDRVSEGSPLITFEDEC